MTNSSRKLFNSERSEILIAKINEPDNVTIPDDYVFAWLKKLYPLYNGNVISCDIEKYFSISKEQVSKILVFLEKKCLHEEYCTFYDVEEIFGKRGSKEYSRDNLVHILRYAYMHGCFNETFWGKMLGVASSPIEARHIISKFDPFIEIYPEGTKYQKLIDKKLKR